MLTYAITQAGPEPVTVEEVKLFCRVDSDEEDTLFPTLISAARRQAEHNTGRVLRSSRYDVFCEGESGVVEIAITPCTELHSVTVDGVVVDSALYAFTPSSNEISGIATPARISFLDGYPTEQKSIFSIQAGIATVEDAIKTWILVKVNTLYEQREAFAIGQNYNILDHSFIDGLLDSQTIFGGF